MLYYLVRWAGNPPSQPLQSHASRSGHTPLVPSLSPPPPSSSRAPGTSPTQHGTSPGGGAVRQLINMSNMLLNVSEKHSSQFRGITWSITSLGFSASLFSLVRRPLGGIRIYMLWDKIKTQFSITTQTKNKNNIREVQVVRSPSCTAPPVWWSSWTGCAAAAGSQTGSSSVLSASAE